MVSHLDDPGGNPARLNIDELDDHLWWAVNVSFPNKKWNDTSLVENYPTIKWVVDSIECPDD